jgi:hypothetical protein
MFFLTRLLFNLWDMRPDVEMSLQFMTSQLYDLSIYIGTVANIGMRHECTDCAARMK